MRFTLWDNNSAVHGIDPDVLRSSYPLPVGGRLLIVEDDDGGLVMVQPTMPGVGGHIAITEANLAEAQNVLEAQLAPAPTDEAPSQEAQPTPASASAPTPAT